MKQYYHILTDTTNGYQDITKGDSMKGYPIVNEIDMLLDMVSRLERKLTRPDLTYEVELVYKRYANELNICIELLINY